MKFGKERFGWTALLALLPLLAAGTVPVSAARAQTQNAQPVQKPLAIKVGLFFPTGGDLKTVFGEVL